MRPLHDVTVSADDDYWRVGRPSLHTDTDRHTGCVLCTMSQWVPTMITGELGARAFTQIQTDIQGASFARCHSECRRWLLESWAPEPSHRYRQTYRVHPLHHVTASADDDYWRVGRPSLHTDTDKTYMVAQKLAPFFVRLNFTKY